MHLAKPILSYDNYTVSVLDKEVYLTAPIAENEPLTFLALMAALLVSPGMVQWLCHGY